MTQTIPNKADLARQCYEQKQECEISDREFDCLIYLINDGTIKTWNELAAYGIDPPEQE